MHLVLLNYINTLIFVLKNNLRIYVYFEQVWTLKFFNRKRTFLYLTDSIILGVPSPIIFNCRFIIAMKIIDVKFAKWLLS